MPMIRGTCPCCGESKRVDPDDGHCRACSGGWCECEAESEEEDDTPVTSRLKWRSACGVFIKLRYMEKHAGGKSRRLWWWAPVTGPWRGPWTRGDLENDEGRDLALTWAAHDLETEDPWEPVDRIPGDGGFMARGAK